MPVTIIALAFAALGLPDGALGVAWPSVRREFALPVSGFGSLLLVMMAGHLVASIGSGPAAARLGPGRLLLWSTLAYAASAFGFAPLAYLVNNPMYCFTGGCESASSNGTL